MSEDYTSDGINAIKTGDKQQARKFLSLAVRQDPNNEKAWSWLYGCVDTPEQRKYCIEKVLSINPKNEKARKALAKINQEEESPFDIPAASSPIQIQSSVVVPPARVEAPKKKWSPAVKILTFLFITPLWTIIVLDDPDSPTSVKVVAIILLVLYVLFICNLISNFQYY